MTDLKRYQYGALAARLLQSEEGQPHVGSSLEKLAFDLGIGDTAEGFIKGAMASEDGIKTAAGVYAGKYAKEMDGATFQELYDSYDSVLKDYLKEDSPEYANIKGEFEKYKDDKFGSVKKKLDTAQKMAKVGKDLGHSDEEIAGAKKTLDKYKKIITIISTLEDDKFEKLRSSVTKSTFRNALKELGK